MRTNLLQTAGMATTSLIVASWIVLPASHADVFLSGDTTPAPSGISATNQANLQNYDVYTNVMIGATGMGDLTINGGTFVNADLYQHNTLTYVGYGANSTGTVTVTGANSQWHVNHYQVPSPGSAFYVGYGGKGTLDVLSGGYMKGGVGFIGNLSNSSGSVVISGANSKWDSELTFTVGNYGTGALTVTNGGFMTSGTSYLGVFPGSTGAVLVTGSGSKWTIPGRPGGGYLYMGGSASKGGRATLTIENGGLVDVGYGVNAGFYGPSVSSLINVRGAGSKLTTGYLELGNYQATATLNIEDGGFVQNTNALLGDQYNAIGIVNVGSATTNVSTWNNLSGVTVGGGDTGLSKLTITNGGLVEVGSGGGGIRDLVIAKNATSAGAVTLAGGTLDLNGHNITVGTGPTAYFNFTGGRLADVSTFNAAKLKKDPGNVNQTANGTLYQQGGTLQIGNSLGTMTITGNYKLFPGAVIEFDLADDGGVAGTDFDALTVTTNADFGGIIQISYLGGFQASTNDLFKILNFGSFTDSGVTFDFSNAALAPGLVWSTEQFAKAGIIFVGIPEPTTLALLGVGALLFFQRRRQDDPCGESDAV